MNYSLIDLNTGNTLGDYDNLGHLLDAYISLSIRDRLSLYAVAYYDNGDIFYEYSSDELDDIYERSEDIRQSVLKNIEDGLI